MVDATDMEGCDEREWQVTGKPCKHALAWILSNRGLKIENYVHDYYSVAKFKAAYEDRVEPLPDRSEWSVVHLGFKVYPPLLGRGAGRPKVQRHRGCLEKKASKKKVRCKRCGDFGHFAKTCKLAEIGEDGERAPPRSKAEKRKQGAADEVGPSQAKKQKVQKKKKAATEEEARPSQAKKVQNKKKKGTPKKKKTPIKKKLKKAAADPPAVVVSSLRRLVYET